MAVAENRLALNPVDGVELPPVTRCLEQRFLTLDQLHTLATGAGVSGQLVYVLGTCGLRFGKAAELRWRDLDLDNLRLRISRPVTLVDGIFVVGSPKDGKARTASLPGLVADLLEPGDLALQNMVGHESAGPTLDRYGHLYESDVGAVGVAINSLLTRDCGQNVVTAARNSLVTPAPIRA